MECTSHRTHIHKTVECIPVNFYETGIPLHNFLELILDGSQLLWVKVIFTILNDFGQNFAGHIRQGNPSVHLQVGWLVCFLNHELQGLRLICHQLFYLKYLFVWRHQFHLVTFRHVFLLVRYLPVALSISCSACLQVPLYLLITAHKFSRHVQLLHHIETFAALETGNLNNKSICLVADNYWPRTQRQAWDRYKVRFLLHEYDLKPDPTIWLASGELRIKGKNPILNRASQT